MCPKRILQNRQNPNEEEEGRDSWLKKTGSFRPDEQ